MPGQMVEPAIGDTVLSRVKNTSIPTDLFTQRLPLLQRWLQTSGHGNMRPHVEKRFCSYRTLQAQAAGSVSQQGAWHCLRRSPSVLVDNMATNLIEMAKDPAMIYWLDNCENHATAVNENWGRELLELFSMGVSNYRDRRARVLPGAFTGWTILPSAPWPYRPPRLVLRVSGRGPRRRCKDFPGGDRQLNGEDIIRIICEQPATPRFVARHLYNFFVADEARAAGWSVTPPWDPAAIDLLSMTLVNSNYDIRLTLRVLFHSDSFKEARLPNLGARQRWS